MLCWFVEEEVVQNYKVLEGLMSTETTKQSIGFPNVWLQEQSQLNRKGKSPGDPLRESKDDNELLPDWLLIVWKGVWLRLNPSAWLLLDPNYDAASRSS